MQLNFTFESEPVITDYIIVIATPTKPGSAEAARQVFPPPQLNPHPISLYVPTPQVHKVDVYESPDGVVLGVLASSFNITPKIDFPGFIEPLTLIVDGGRTDTDGNVIDPVDGATFIKIPSIANYVISTVQQRGAGVLISDRSTDQNEYEPYEEGGTYKGGITLLNGKTFNSGEEYTIFFEPFFDPNAAISINDLTDLITEHIADTTNPHEVTKDQVGLGNLPNVKSDAIDANDSNSLATSKAVFTLAQEITNLQGFIKGKGSSGITAVNAQQHALQTITHNLNIAGPYIAIISLRGNSVNATSDDHVTAVTRNYTANAFDVALVNPSNSNASIIINYIIL
jgi:hypothetical protein